MMGMEKKNWLFSFPNKDNKKESFVNLKNFPMREMERK